MGNDSQGRGHGLQGVGQPAEQTPGRVPLAGLLPTPRQTAGTWAGPRWLPVVCVGRVPQSRRGPVGYLGPGRWRLDLVQPVSRVSRYAGCSVKSPRWDGPFVTVAGVPHPKGTHFQTPHWVFCSTITHDSQSAGEVTSLELCPRQRT